MLLYCGSAIRTLLSAAAEGRRGPRIPPKGGTELRPSDSPVKREDIRGEESVLTCDLVTVSTVPLEPAQVPEETASSKPLAALVQKKPALEEGAPSGDRWTGKTIDWGSPRL